MVLNVWTQNTFLAFWVPKENFLDLQFQRIQISHKYKFPYQISLLKYRPKDKKSLNYNKNDLFKLPQIDMLVYQSLNRHLLIFHQHFILLYPQI